MTREAGFPVILSASEESRFIVTRRCFACFSMTKQNGRKWCLSWRNRPAGMAFLS